MRLGVGVIGCGLLVLALSSSTPAANRAESEPVADQVITVQYEGTLDAIRQPMGEHPRGPDLHEAHYRWSLVWTGRRSVLATIAGQRFETRRLSGTVKYVDNVQLPAEKNRNDCVGTYSARPGAKIPVVVTLDPDNRKGFGVQLTRPVSDTYLVSSNKKSNFDLCTRVFAGLLPSKSQIVSPFFRFPPKGGTRSNPVRSNQTLPPNDKYRTSIDESVTVKVGGTAGEPAPNPNAKAVARNDFRRAFERAKGPCLHFAISLGVIATGSVWTSVGAPVPGGIPAGGAVIATGAVMGQAVAPLCLEVVKQLIVSYTIYKRDPPVPKTRAALRLSSCARWEGKVRAYCTELSAAVRELVSAERAVLPALKRLQGAARTKGDVPAAVASLQGARRKAGAAGREVARIVRSAGVRGALSRAESADVVAALLAELGRRGVPASDVRTVVPAASLQRPIDVLAALGA